MYASHREDQRGRRVIRSFLFGGLGLLLSGCGDPNAPLQHAMPPPPTVSVAEVVVKDVVEWDEFTGHIEAVETVEIRPRVAGYIERVNFQEGQLVGKEDVLFVIDQRPFKAELVRAEAELARMRARAKLSSLQALRGKKLLEKRVLSPDAYDELHAANLQAQADVRAAEAALAVARLNLDYTQVRSPIDGRAGRALVKTGNLVSGGEMIPNATLLTTVVSVDPVHVYFDTDEQTYLRHGEAERPRGHVKTQEESKPVYVGLADETGFPHTASLDFIDNRLDPATGTIRARAVLDNPEYRFTPGLFARIRLPGKGPFPTVLVDDKAVLTDQDRHYVYLIGKSDTALRRDVKLGRTVDGLRIVSEGLAKGDRIVVHGVQKILFPGMGVIPQMITMGDPPAVSGDHPATDAAKP